MKKKATIIIGIIALLVLGVAIWWFSPKIFLNNVNPGDIASIEVFNGNTGKKFTITEQEDISFITGNVQSVSMKKEKITVRMGYKYNMKFVNESGNEIDKFILMGPTTIKKGVIFYKCDGQLKLVENYLASLENKQSSNKDGEVGN